jgi:divalent metal cation (Fe/Co/Zn/Cd) transporter
VTRASTLPSFSVAEARRARAVSLVSLIWTLAVSVVACTLGVIDNSLVLVAFGAIGLLDAAGSVALLVHFRHSIRHEAHCERHEQLALNVVTVGLFVLGAVTAFESVHRLMAGERTTPGVAGVVLAGLSALVLALLARTKRGIGERLGSPALRADGWVSAVGAALALVTLIGTGLTTAASWTSADPAAATVVAIGAVVLSVELRRQARRSSAEQL